MSHVGHARRLETLRFIRAYLKKYGRAPSHREMADKLGRSRSGVELHLRILHAEGRIDMGRGMKRAIRVK